MMDELDRNFTEAHDETARNLLATVDGRDNYAGLRNNKKDKDVFLG